MSDALFDLTDVAPEWTPILYAHRSAWRGKTHHCRDCGADDDHTGGVATSAGIGFICGDCSTCRVGPVDRDAQERRRAKYRKAVPA